MSDGVTGTIYGLVDPRDGETRYVGQTKRAPSVRLSGHFSGKNSPRVRSWIGELRAAGLKPRIEPIREGVPAAELFKAERGEITRIMLDGGILLNELSTATGREILRQREEAARHAAWAAGWKELADAAVAILGGPLTPAQLPGLVIPDKAWDHISRIEPGWRQEMEAALHPDRSVPGAEGNGYRSYGALQHEQEEAAESLWRGTRGAWGELLSVAGDRFEDRMQSHFQVVAEKPCSSRADLARHLALIPWYMAVVVPWRQLGRLAGLPVDDASFIAWAGRDPETRDALIFLASRSEGTLAKLAGDDRRDRDLWDRGGPGRLLACVTAAYTGTHPASAIRDEIRYTLEKRARDHQLTGPMADLFAAIDPAALDAAYGKDITAELDQELALPAGTSGLVLRGLLKRLGTCNDPEVQNAADRSTQKFPIVTLSDYPGWNGGVVTARIVMASVVNAGLAVPADGSPEDYVAAVRALWAPDATRMREGRAA